MTAKTILISAILALAPTLGLAQGCLSKQTTMSCAEGMVLDTETGTCVVQTTS